MHCKITFINLYLKFSSIKTIFIICWLLLSKDAISQKKSDAAILLQTIPFKQFTGGVIIFKASIDSNNNVLNFILDTGSGGLSIDSTTAENLHLKLTPTNATVKGIAGSNKVSYAFNRKLITGDLVTDSLNFYINDYSILTSVYGEKIDGIIGYGLLSKYIFHINFDSSLIHIYSKGKYYYDAASTVIYPNINKLITYPLTIKDKQKLVSNVYLDSGAGLDILLTESYVKDNGLLLTKRRPVITEVQGLGGKKTVRLTVVKRIQFGKYIFRNVPANLYNDDEKVIDYPNVVGLLGNNIMRRFNIVLNYPNNEISIIPNNSFYESFDYAYTGMFMYNINNKIFVDDIVKNSPAEKAGIKNGDEILCVANNCSGIVKKYENLLQNTNESIRIILVRNGKLLFLEISPISIK